MQYRDYSGIHYPSWILEITYFLDKEIKDTESITRTTFPIPDITKS